MPIPCRSSALFLAIAVLVAISPDSHHAQPATAKPTRSSVPAAASLLARISGRTVVPGLDSAVEVRRDRWGVPHIYARTQHDLFFAQGFVAAQDRLWQMEMWRRQGEGRLAEVLGPSAVERDRVARLFKYRGDMDAEWRAYAPDAREIVTAFVDGVNAYIAQVKDRPPIEFFLLDFSPEPWSPEVALARVTSLSGLSNGSSEVLRAQLVQLVGAEKAEQVFPTDPHRALDPAPGLDLAGIDASSLGRSSQAFSDVAYTRVEGSNNWVVSGKKTASGKPILANDPHRAIGSPAVRYITHLVGPGWNVIGAGEPASPGVAIGHNDRIGFGLTVVGMDQQDVYVERLARCDSVGVNARAASARSVAERCYLHGGQWKPLRTIVDTIRVKGGAPREVRLDFTAHGPVVSEDTTRGRAIAVRGVWSEPGTAAYLASLSLGRARDWESFKAAMARWRTPSENMIYADVDGNIGWIAAGLMPRRAWSGLLPVPGDGRYEWSGFVPIDELPQAYNPPSGYIATANHNILPDGYTTPISYEWASRYRIDRLHQVLRPGSKFTVDDFKRLQHDDRSLLAETLVPSLLSAAHRAGIDDRREIAVLQAWDFRMSRDREAPLIFAAWAPALARRISGAGLTPAAASVLGGRTNYPLVEQLMRSPDERFGSDPERGRDLLALLALDDAIAELTTRFGRDRRRWTWGAVHKATFRHPLSAAFDLGSVSRGGDGNTVYATGGRLYQQTSGASYREIIDFADFDNSVATNVPGQSAQPGSPHYGDLLPLWGRDEYFPLVFSRARVERETKNVLWLAPGPGGAGRGSRE